MKTLLIESDASFARELESVLAARGVEARITGDGRQAVEVARAERPDAIVLCVELAGMSGYSACNRLRKDAELKSVPLVITSAEATPETFEQHKRLKTRADAYLMKPFQPTELLEVLGGLTELPPPPPGWSAPAPSNDSPGELEGANDPQLAPEDDLRLIDEAFERVAPLELSGEHALSPEPEGDLELVPELEVEVNPFETSPGEAGALEHLERMGAEADEALDALGAGDGGSPRTSTSPRRRP